jgi:FMN phosphatase YigB (HAD superfamily)
MTSQTVFVDMDGVLCDYQTAFNRERLRDPAQPFPQCDHRFLMLLQIPCSVPQRKTPLRAA